MNLRERLYLSTIAEDAARLARGESLGVELAAFCTASNMDMPDFAVWSKRAEEDRAGARGVIFHAPFAELFPSAIDPLAVRLAEERLNQAYALCERFGARRMVVHSGFVPTIYYKEWFTERSVLFWRRFLADKPAAFELLIENVLEDEPYTLAGMVRQIDDPRARLCFDVGHANAAHSSVPLADWARIFAPALAHVHLHDNDGSHDWHRPLGEGTIDFGTLLPLLSSLAPDASFTIENLRCAPSLDYLRAHGWL